MSVCVGVFGFWATAAVTSMSFVLARVSSSSDGQLGAAAMCSSSVRFFVLFARCVSVSGGQEGFCVMVSVTVVVEYRARCVSVSGGVFRFCASCRCIFSFFISASFCSVCCWAVWVFTSVPLCAVGV